jgi:CII-binding regulator of phage lambda lysogenization HflD
MIIKAILKINPNAKVIVRGDDIENRDLGKVTIEWLDDTTPISKADIEAQFPIVELENAMSTLRAKRNKLLQDTDFYGMSDNTMSSEMATYRQALRDITSGITTVEQANAVVFPTKP